jgi:tyrosine-specific transport protein
MKIGKLIGCIMLVMGTSIGGGILALPIVGIGAGLVPTLLTILFLWAVVLLSGFLFVELTLSFPAHENSFHAIAGKTLGRSGKIVTFISYLFLLYALVAAYISGGGSLLSELLRIGGLSAPGYIYGLLFTVALGSFVIRGVKAVDYLNRIFFSVKVLFLFLTLFLLIPHVNLSQTLIHESHFRYLLAASPIYVCAFGYHILIPTLTNYLHGQSKQIRLVIFLGTFLTMLIYAVWLLDIIGIVSFKQFESFAHNGGSTGEFVAMIMNAAHSRWVDFAINSFANVTITTSFLGVSLSLFDFLADALKRPSHVHGKVIISLLTFLPPLLFALFYPKGFITALGYASLCVSFSLILLPALMVWQLRKKNLGSSYQVFGGYPLLIIISIIAIALILLQVLDQQHLLPIF